MFYIKHNSINFILRQVDTNFDRVSNIALTSSDLPSLHRNLAKRAFKVSDFKDCSLFPHQKSFDLQSPFKNIKHRIYDDKVTQHDSESLIGNNLFRDVDHVLFCCEKNTAHQHAMWYNSALGTSHYQCQVSKSIVAAWGTSSILQSSIESNYY